MEHLNEKDFKIGGSKLYRQESLVVRKEKRDTQLLNLNQKVKALEESIKEASPKNHIPERKNKLVKAQSMVLSPKIHFEDDELGLNIDSVIKEVPIGYQATLCRSYSPRRDHRQ